MSVVDEVAVSVAGEVAVSVVGEVAVAPEPAVAGKSLASEEPSLAAVFSLVDFQEWNPYPSRQSHPYRQRSLRCRVLLAPEPESSRDIADKPNVDRSPNGS